MAYDPNSDPVMQALAKGVKGLPPAPGTPMPGSSVAFRGEKKKHIIPVPESLQAIVQAWLDELAKLSPEDYKNCLEHFGLQPGEDIPFGILQELGDKVRDCLEQLRTEVAADPADDGLTEQERATRREVAKARAERDLKRGRSISPRYSDR